MSEVILKGLKKIYDNKVTAVHDVNLTIKDKEFIVLVGPSGCGKSTTLRMVAGLESISDGELYIDGKLMNDIVPKDRDIAMVFQNYALYPHMTVRDNMAFALKLKRTPKAEIESKVNEVAKILGITQYLTQRGRQDPGNHPVSHQKAQGAFRRTKTACRHRQSHGKKPEGFPDGRAPFQP